MLKLVFSKEYKREFTVAEYEIATRLKREYEDETPAAEYLKDAANLFGYAGEVIRARAEISKNIRTYNAFGDYTETLDIWITGLVYMVDYGPDNRAAYLELGAYLTDIWNIAANNHDEVKQHMYARAFKEA